MTFTKPFFMFIFCFMKHEFVKTFNVDIMRFIVPKVFTFPTSFPTSTFCGLVLQIEGSDVIL